MYFFPILDGEIFIFYEKNGKIMKTLRRIEQYFAILCCVDYVWMEGKTHFKSALEYLIKN